MKNKNKKRRPKALMRILSFILSLSLVVTNPYTYDLFEVFGVNSLQVVYAEEGENAVDGEKPNDGEGEGANDEEGLGSSDSEGEGANDEEGLGSNDGEGEGANDEVGLNSNGGEGEGANDEEGLGSSDSEGKGTNNEEGLSSSDGEGEGANDDKGLGSSDGDGEGANDEEGEGANDAEVPTRGVRSVPEHVPISTISGLVRYSKEYDSSHSNDILDITITSSPNPNDSAYQTTATLYQFAEFVSIGTEDAPFAGTVNFSVSPYTYLNFDKPMFGYITDSATINVLGGNNGYLELRRPSTNEILPIFAMHVIHDEDWNPASEAEFREWKIKINYYNEEGETLGFPYFPCVIGEIGSNCKLSLAIQNDAKTAANQEHVKATGEVGNENGDVVNAGLICGILGENAKLKAAVSGTNTDFNITSEHGHAGALIGEMLSGSVLTLAGSNIANGTRRTITASNGYAGGLVGSVTNATINFASGFTVNETINGKLGAGGVAGYYNSGSSTSFGLSNSSIDCTVTSANAGGVFGVLETSGNFTFNESGNTYSIASTADNSSNGSYYGGLIGCYKTNLLSNTLSIDDITVSTKGSGKNCAGLIGKIDNSKAAYIVIEDVIVNNTITSNFSGIVNNAGNAGHFLNIGDFTLTSSNYSGAGLVNTIGAGVIRLHGETDLSSAKSSGAQLVNSRGNAIIYALGNGSDSGWTLNRCASVAYDDIGNWGEVLRISSVNEYTGSSDADTTSGTDNHILSFDSTEHKVTVVGPPTSGNTTTVATKNEFIRTALNMQINQGDLGALQFADDVNNATKLLGSSSKISVTGSISLSGTGIMGLMRDDGKQNINHSTTESDAAFAGTLEGGGTVTLATGEYYGKRGGTVLTANGAGNGALHNHAKCGLLSVTNAATINNITVAGSIYTISTNDGMCLGGFVGQSKGNLSMSGISETVVITGHSNDDDNKFFGGVIGEAEGDGAVISISGTNGSTINVNGKKSIFASNGIGYVENNTITINFTNYTLGSTSGSTPSAKLANPSDSGMDYTKCAGLIGYVKSGSNKKTVNINGVTISHYQLDLTGKKGIGGLLGYAWYNTDVNIPGTGTAGLTISDCDVDQSYTSKGTEATDLSAAGLVYVASGHWTVEKLKICDTDFGLNGVTSFGVLINKGYCDNIENTTNVLFLELKSKYGADNGFDLSDDVTVTDNKDKLAVYDELVAYSAFLDSDGNSKVLKEGNGVVSIHTASGTVVGGKYENQISISDSSLYDNKNTRYYYDLDVIRNAVTTGTYPSGSSEAEQNAYKLMMWNLKQYAHSSIQSYFMSDNNVSEPLSGNYDLSKVSYYPLNRSTSLSIGAASFTFNNKNIEDSAVAGSTYRSTMDSDSQHYLMHCGLFYNVTGNITITDDITLSGSVGKHENGSGAIIAGTLGGLSAGTTMFGNSSNKSITLNGLVINSSASYKPVLINRISDHVSLTLNGVETAADSYKNGDGVNMAGSSLIGIVGKKDGGGKANSDSINLTFNDIRLDARTDANKGDSALSALSTAYGTTQSVFTRATLLDEFIFNNNTDCKGVYNFRLDEDWNGSVAVHHVTYGFEIDGTSEFVGLQKQYVDMLGKTHPESYDDTQGDSSYSFSSFLPYVYTRDYDDDDMTKRSREIMVNHTNVSITQGCGTYNDPYIIDANGQIEAIAKILELGAVSDGFQIKVPKITKVSGSGASATFTYKTWCGNDDITLTYGSGTYVASNTSYNHTNAQLAKYLAGAYYKITKVTKTAGEGVTPTYESITISGASFNGLGGTENDYAFHGVIVGDSDTSTYPLVNNTGAPLIKTSYGSVVKNLCINVRNGNIVRSQSDNTQKFVVGGGCANYGAVMGQILGGDNIIDTVTVDYTGSIINLDGSVPKIIPVGGFVGVVASGALMFRGTNSSNLTGKVRNNNTVIGMADTNWLYVNPIIGRVLNGYAVYEAASNPSSNDYKYGESSVTMKNGTKNYSIADIDPDLDKVQVSAYTKKGSTTYYTTNVMIPNAQSMYILSLLMQSKTIGNNKYVTAMKTLSSDSYNDYKIMRHAKYDQVGRNDVNSDYETYAKYDTKGLGDVTVSTGFKYAPYLVERYTSPVGGLYYVLSLTNVQTVCNMTLSGNEDDWYLPDGFKGVGYIGYNKSDSDGISLHKFDGNGKKIHLNMSLKHYSTSMDNYCPSSGNVGFGLFSSIRHNAQYQGGAISSDDLEEDDYKIHNLKLTGNIDYDVVDVSIYSSTNVNVTKYIDVGGFAGYCGYGKANDLRIEDIDLSDLSVNGFKTAGGLFGYLNMEKSNVYLAKISNITAENGTLMVTSKQYVGGLVGRAEQIGLTIEHITLDDLSVLTDNNGTDYNNGVGGIIGKIMNNDGNSTYSSVTLDDITIGDEEATDNLRFGYREDAPLHDTSSNTYYRIATGGLIGHSLMNNNQTKSDYGLIISNCYVYNVDLYGHRVGGILGHDSNGESNASASNLKFSNVHVISTNDASINGLIYNNNYGLSPTDKADRGNLPNRGCGGIAGYIKNSGYNVMFEDCSVEGYILQSYNDTGGLCSNIQDSGNLYIQNVALKNLTISSCYHGALFGYMKKTTTGYNILIDNIQFEKFYNNNYIQRKYGYLIGNNAGTIKFVGLTRQGTLDSDHRDRICGKKDDTNSVLQNYGSNGYIIWADALGASTDTTTAGTKQSNLINKTTVVAKSPWVTVSPSINISGTGASTSQVLTGDSIISSYDAADALSVSSLADVPSAAKTNYLNYRGGTNGKTQLFSTYETEMGAGSLPEGVSDFAVIVVESDATEISDAINCYVQMLTHTYPSGTNDNNWRYATKKNNSIYQISIYRCTYNETLKVFEKTDGSGGLTRDSNDPKDGFIPHVADPDNAAETACFTLVDVQFLNPSNSNEVCYHVYVPVLVKKLVKFQFKASSMPGTVYDDTYYLYQTSSHETEDKWGNPSVTNLGTPVTVYFRYEYMSPVEEWQAMIDSGDSLMWHANKKLLFKTVDENLPNGARMVLVNAKENGKAYYAKTSDTGVFTLNSNSSQNDYYLDLTKFKDGSDEFYVPVNFGERLPITASTTPHSGAKAYVISASGEAVYVKATLNGETKGFRPAGDSDVSATKYYLTVDGTVGNAPNGLTEEYYLTIYTDEGNDALRVISVSSASSLTSAPLTGDGISRHSLRCVNQMESALVLGNIYKQTFTTFETENAQNGLVDNGCNYIESDIAVEITVNNDNDEAEKIIRYLNNPSIKLYHSIILMLTKNDGTSTEKNIYGTPTYSVNTAKAQAGVYGSISSKLTNSTTNVSGFSIDTPQKVSNFIQICDSDFDIKPLLIETRTNPETGPGVPDVLYGGAIITISGLRTHFDFQNIQNQFPYRPNENSTIGTIVTAYSMLDSDATNVAYSNIREEATDENGVRYHGEQPEVATLVYAVDTSSEVELIQNLNLLGINPIDDPDYLTNTIIADGTYSAVSFVDSASAQKIRWTLSLEKKNENGIYEAVNMSSYVSGDVFVGNRSTGAKFTVSGNGYVYDEDYTSAMDITTLKTVYAMKTGAELEALGGETPVAGVYSNYKVTLTATLYTGTGALSGDLSDRVISGSQKSDYIVYTNAKVKPSWVKSE